MYINLQVSLISSDVRSISSTGPWLAGRTTASQDRSLVLIGWAPDIVAGYNVVQQSDVNICDVICVTSSYHILSRVVEGWCTDFFGRLDWVKFIILQCIDALNWKHWHETSILWSASSAGSKGSMFAALVPLRGCTPSNLWNGDDGLQGSWTLDRVALMSSVSFKSASRCLCCCMHFATRKSCGGLDWKAAT